MSSTETHIGKLTRYPFKKNVKFEDRIKYILNNHKLEYDDKNMIEVFNNELYDIYRIYNEVIYMVEDKYIPDDGDIFEYTKNDDMSISYTLQFYNGGTCLGECLDEIIQKVHDSEN